MFTVPEPDAQPAGRNGKLASASAPARVMSAPPVVAQAEPVHMVHIVEPLATATAPAPSIS
ncbi:unannotated protein [freshwater metagenome]|uniref:Unannotated protein n=1 Tax=freshwater metagenome TaxID=449393 RepID=A0A6J6JQB9_9ZZZZ